MILPTCAGGTSTRAPQALNKAAVAAANNRRDAKGFMRGRLLAASMSPWRAGHKGNRAAQGAALVQAHNGHNGHKGGAVPRLSAAAAAHGPRPPHRRWPGPTAPGGPPARLWRPGPGP